MTFIEASAGGRRRSGAAGFTLLELIFVMSIIALVMGLAAYSLARFDETREIDDVKSALQESARLARRLASDSGQSVWVVVQRDGVTVDRRGVPILTHQWSGVEVAVRQLGSGDWQMPETFYWEFAPRQLGEPTAFKLASRGVPDIILEFNSLTGEGRVVEGLR